MSTATRFALHNVPSGVFARGIGEGTCYAVLTEDEAIEQAAIITRQARDQVERYIAIGQAGVQAAPVRIPMNSTYSAAAAVDIVPVPS